MCGHLNQNTVTTSGVEQTAVHRRRWIWYVVTVVLLSVVGPICGLTYYFGARLLLIRRIERVGGQVETEPVITGVNREMIGNKFLHYFEEPTHVRYQATRIGERQLAPLRGLPKLESVDLRNSRVDGDALRHIKALSELHSLSFFRSDVGDDGLGAFRR